MGKQIISVKAKIGVYYRRSMEQQNPAVLQAPRKPARINFRNAWEEACSVGYFFFGAEAGGGTGAGFTSAAAFCKSVIAAAPNS